MTEYVVISTILNILLLIGIVSLYVFDVGYYGEIIESLNTKIALQNDKLNTIRKLTKEP